MLTTGLSDDHLVTLVGVNRKWILEDYSQISSLLGEEMVRVHQEIQDAIQSIDPVAEYQYYAQSHRYFTSTTHIVPVISSIPQVFYQYYTHCTSTTLNTMGILPVLHTQYQYYAQSHKYFTSSTHSTRPVLNLQYQFYPYCTSITDGFRFSIPKKHVQTLFLISIETQE